ncbi:hypothetical protein ACFV4P_15955 [Kitasatospora sp. NPDC059795]
MPATLLLPETLGLDPDGALLVAEIEAYLAPCRRPPARWCR